MKAKLILSERDFELTLTALRGLGSAGLGAAAFLRRSRAKNAATSQGKRSSVRVFVTLQHSEIIGRAYQEGGLKSSDSARLRGMLASALREAHDKTHVRAGSNPAATGRKQQVRHVSGRANPR